MKKIIWLAAGLLLATSNLAMAQSTTEACLQAFQSRQIRTATGWIKCTIAAAAPGRSGAHQDVLTAVDARMLAIAEKIDRKEISLAEGNAQISSVVAAAGSEIQRRDALSQAAAQARTASEPRMTFCNQYGTMTVCN